MSAISARERGGAPVASMQAVTAAEALLIACLRNWCGGDTGRVRASDELTAALDPKEAQSCLAAFERLCALLLAHGRRPLMRHHVRCACVDSDETLFANLVMMAASGSRPDAELVA